MSTINFTTMMCCNHFLTVLLIPGWTRNAHNHRNNGSVFKELKLFHAIACRSCHFLRLNKTSAAHYFSPIIVIQFISGVLQKHHLRPNQGWPCTGVWKTGYPLNWNWSLYLILKPSYSEKLSIPYIGGSLWKLPCIEKTLFPCIGESADSQL